jgi:beta-galactosidase
LFIGSFLTFPGKNSSQFLLGLLDWAKISRPFRTSQDGADPENPLEARLHENRQGYLLFLVNHSETAKPLTVDLSVKEDGQFRLNEIVHKQVWQKRSRNRTLSFGGDLPGKEVAIWDIRRTN